MAVCLFVVVDHYCFIFIYYFIIVIVIVIVIIIITIILLLLLLHLLFEVSSTGFMVDSHFIILFACLISHFRLYTTKRDYLHILTKYTLSNKERTGKYLSQLGLQSTP